MFTIIGGDGKEYGPASADQLRAWIAAGRANLDTKAKAVGSEEWRRLGDFAEFASPEGAPPAVGTMPVAAASSIAPTNLADRGTRLGARFIDWVLAFAGFAPGVAILGGEFIKLVVMAMQGHEPDVSQLDTQRLILGGIVAGIGWLVILIVQVVLLSTRGQTVGKMILKLRVVRIDGTQAGFVHAWLLRECVMTVIGVVVGIIPLVGPLLFRPAFHITDWCMIYRQDHRCLHDLIAGTQVVRVTPPAAP
jgi:uncharacterized RDD family membrane protein YckC